MTGYVADLSWKSGMRDWKVRSTKVDAGDFKHELLNRLRSTMAVNVLIYILLSHYRGLFYPVYHCGWFYHFTLVDSIIWLPSHFYSFLLNLVYGHTSGFSPIFHQFFASVKVQLTHPLSYLLTYSSFVSKEHADNMFFTVS